MTEFHSNVKGEIEIYAMVDNVKIYAGTIYRRIGRLYLDTKDADHLTIDVLHDIIEYMEKL